MIFDIVTSIVILWVLWIIVASVRPHLTHGHNPLIEGVIHLLSFVFVAYDVIFNYTWGSIIFQELPSGGRHTLSQRLQHIIKTESIDSWKWKLSMFACKYMIEPWEPGHCRLGK